MLAFSSEMHLEGGSRLIRFTRASHFQIVVFCVLFNFFSMKPAGAAPALLGVSPDNSEELVLKTIRETRESLLINIYQYDHPSITQSLSKKIRSGAHVELLIEGEPLGGISSRGWQTLKTLHRAIQETPGSTSMIFLMKKSDSTQNKRRFRFNHAKYMISDQSRVFVSSENFTSGGQPLPGKIGNRGWSILIDDSATAQRLSEIFSSDKNPKYEDIVEFDPKKHKNNSIFAATPASESIELTEPIETQNKPITPQRTLPSFKTQKASFHDLQLITAPKALQDLQKILRSARHQMSIEMMSMPPEWRSASSDPSGAAVINPLLSEVIQSARRGIQVRLLLNDERAFSNTPPSRGFANDRTVSLLNRIADCYGLPLEGRIVDRKALQITYIHNKGILVDDDTTLVSSINGTQNSISNNREVAIQVQSPDVHRYYQTVFDQDWDFSTDVIPTPPLSSLRFLMNPAECPSLDYSLRASPLPFQYPPL